MKALRILIVVLFLAVTLAYTVAAVTPALAGPSSPNMECEGYVCIPEGGCPLPTTARECNNACWVGGNLRCMDSTGWRCILWCPE